MIFRNLVVGNNVFNFLTLIFMGGHGVPPLLFDFDYLKKYFVYDPNFLSLLVITLFTFSGQISDRNSAQFKNYHHFKFQKFGISILIFGYFLKMQNPCFGGVNPIGLILLTRDFRFQSWSYWINSPTPHPQSFSSDQVRGL